MKKREKEKNRTGEKADKIERQRDTKRQIEMEKKNQSRRVVCWLNLNLS